MCKNCQSTVGPFYHSWKEKGEIVITTEPLCKNTTLQPNRIAECVERRNKIDIERYKDQMHPYA